MAYTLSSVTTRVQDRIKDTGFSTSTIRSFLNDVQRDIFNDYRLPFMETSVSYTLTAGDSDITSGAGLPANFDQVVALAVTTDGAEQLITYKSIPQILQEYPDPSSVTSSAPRYWYRYGNEIKVFPSPDLAYTVTLYYIKKPTELSNDADVPEVPSNFEELLVLGATYRVHEVKDNYDKAAITERRYIEALDQMVNRYSKRQARVRIMPINRRRNTGIF